jgi:type I restriction enzyme S subunit
MKPYDSYKKTNMSWLTDIPSHWKLERIGTLFFERKTKVSDKDYPPLSVTKRGILPQLATAAKSDDSNNRKKVVVGDFVINSRSDRKGSSGISPLTGSVSLINIALEPRQENNKQFMHYLLRSNSFIEEYYRNGRGIVADLWTTRFSEMKTIMLPLPPRVEQDQIVHFLDWQLSKINKLIKAKKKQIVLFNEQKKAIIDKAITKGLNDSIPKKESGINWIGDIPVNWKTGRLKRFCKVNASISHLTSNYNGEDMVVFLPMENVSAEGEIDCSILRKFKEVRSGYSSFAKNDVVVAKITPCFENGKGACLDKLETEIGYGTTEFITLRAYECILPKYLYYITRTSYFRLFGIEVMTGSAGQKRVPTDFISNFIIGIPQKIEEQRMIVDYIEKKISMINNTLTKLTKELDYITEYKDSLISSVVTGKLNVKNIVVPEFENEILEEKTEALNDEIEALEVDE